MSAIFLIISTSAQSGILSLCFSSFRTFCFSGVSNIFFSPNLFNIFCAYCNYSQISPNKILNSQNSQNFYNKQLKKSQCLTWCVYFLLMSHVAARVFYVTQSSRVTNGFHLGTLMSSRASELSLSLCV